MRFLDTNLLIRLFTRDDPAKTEAVQKLLEKVEYGKEKVAISEMVIFEVVFTLQKSYKIRPVDIRKLILPIIKLRGIKLSSKSLFEKALDLFVSLNISFSDAYNAAFAQNCGISEIYSYDKDFDRISGLKRVEPEVSS